MGNANVPSSYRPCLEQQRAGTAQFPTRVSHLTALITEAIAGGQTARNGVFRDGRKHQRPAGQDTDGELAGRQDEQQRHREVPAAGGVVDQPDFQWSGGGYEVADGL